MKKVKNMFNNITEAIEHGFETRASGIVEKNGKYNTANNWDEIQRAETNGWKYVGHPVDLKKKLKK